MKILAHAKLNLFLEITGKRADGYHELFSQVIFLDLADEISLRLGNEIKITGAGIENNIILRTANLLKEKFAIKEGAELHLVKNIPLGGGLGGGSADAAVTLAALNKFWNLNLPKPELYKIALTLGADVPVCLYSILENKNTAYFCGIGEIISEAPDLPPYHFLLVNPTKPLATKDVFANIPSLPINQNNQDNFFSRRNDLEEPAIRLMPEIRQILDALKAQENCLLARMTGSGSSCFGIFESAHDAGQARQAIANRPPGWFVKIAVAKP